MARATGIAREQEIDDELPWKVSVEDVLVTSPNWDKNDQSSRQWKGKDSLRRDCFFIIDDEEFWSHVRDRDLRVNVLDKLRVQWAYQMADGRAKNRRVLRVLEFNDESLAPPLPSSAISAMIGHYTDGADEDRPADLFDL